MSHERAPSDFGAYLLQAITTAGFANVSRFARAAGRDPSVVHRWISGATSPSAQVLAEVAPTLGVPESELIAAAYPSGPVAEPEPMHPLAAELVRMLRPGSPLADDDRHFLESMLERLIDPYRKKMRRRS